MPEVNQYDFTYTDVIKAMIVSAGVQNGKWTIVVNFNFAGANVGMGDNDAIPSAMIGIPSLALKRAEEGTPPNLVVDAAELASS